MYIHREAVERRPHVAPLTQFLFGDEQWRFVGASWLETVGRLSVKPALQLTLQLQKGPRKFGNDYFSNY